MLLFAEQVNAWGNTTTVHFTHPPRNVMMQFVLAGRADFTEIPPSNPIIRAMALFRSVVTNGALFDMSGAPLNSPSLFSTNAVSEIKGELIANNCGARAIATQYQTSPTAPPPIFTTDADTLVMAFHNPHNGVIKLKHIVKMFAGGRAVSETEALRDAQANAQRLHIDLSALQLKVTSDSAFALADRVEK
jgi:hypothetical protein